MLELIINLRKISNLELTQFGVQELDAKEMVEVDGGGFGPMGAGLLIWFKTVIDIHLHQWTYDVQTPMEA